MAGGRETARVDRPGPAGETPGSGGAFRTLQPSSHARTNLDIIRRFLPVEARLESLGEEDWRVEVRVRDC